MDVADENPGVVAPRTEDIKVYWMPGCSSCVKAKEHLKKLNVPFEPVNVVANPEAMDDLKKLGIRGIPCVTRGTEWVYAQSLEDVTAFLGKVYAPPKVQTPEYIFEKWLFLLDTTISYLKATPPDVLKVEPVKNRVRPVGQLAFHVFQIAEAFVHCMRTRQSAWIERSSGAVDMSIALDKPRLLDYAAPIVAELRKYRDNGEFQSVPMDFEWGLKTTYEFLDRSSWHSAQHMRQVASTLAREGVTLVPQWKDEYFQGLNVPVQLWE